MSQLKRLRESGSQESLVQKYKVTSQISSGSFSIKIKRIYSHHDDDSYANSKMTIEHVNDDCLREIFMYVPVWEKPKIALVCKKWKRVLDDYSWFNVKKLELTHWEYDEYPHSLKKNYPTLDGQFNFLKSLLHKCGHYLRELDLSVYPRCDIVPVINEYCPNLEKLQIRINSKKTPSRVCNEFDFRKPVFDNAFTNLSKLKVLKIILHDCSKCGFPIVPLNIAGALLNVADTLTDLTISNWIISICENAYFPKELINAISQLKALRKFVMFGVRYLDGDFDYFHNNSKTIGFIRDDAGIIDKFNVRKLFEYIRVLNIINWPITDDGIYNIANTMERLHTLHVSCTLLTDTGIVACTKMNNLKSLDFCGSNNTTNSSIKLLKNLRDLNLPYSNKITDESAIKVLENSPDMQNFNVMYTGITYKFIEKAAEISKNRERQLKIWVTLERDMSNTQVEYEYLTVDYDKKE